MKTRLLILSGLLFLSLITFSQKVNLVIFAEDGDKFYAFVNGIKQNDVAGSNVKVTDVTPNISLRIEFEDKALPNLKQNMALEPGFEHTAKIKRDMKKQIKLRYFGRVPLDQSTSNGASTVAYHTADDSNNNTNYNTTTTNTNGGSTNYTTTSTNTQINTSTNSNPNGGSVNISMDPVNLNVNITDYNTGIVTQSSTSTTVTSSSSSSINSPPRTNHYQNQTTTTTSGGCSAAMSPASFDSMKKSVEAKPFSDTKMSTAKVATKSNCMSASQVKEICKLFSMDDDKLTYAKFAYDYCIDKGNFYQVSEAFSFSSTTDDLNAFLEKH